MADETGWVIERYLHSVQHYWGGHDANDWRLSADEAIRFAREQDGAVILAYTLEGIGRVAQHMWVGAANGG